MEADDPGSSSTSYEPVTYPDGAGAGGCTCSGKLSARTWTLHAGETAGEDDLLAALAAGFQTRLPGWS